MLKAVILFFIFLFLSSPTAFAARKIFISSEKNTLRADEEMIVNASASGFLDTENIYVKGAFFKDGSSNYFGFTKDDNDWIKNSASSISQKNVDIGTWDKKLIVKVDFDDSGFSGIGDYKFKIGFYYINTSGNLSSVKWSENNLSVNIAAVPTEIPVSAQSTSEASSETDSQTETNVSVSTPTKTRKISTITPEFDKISSKPKTASEYAKIEQITEKTEVENEPAVLGIKDSKFPKVLVVFGVLFLGIASYRFGRDQFMKRKNI